jgi:hypothetical protein
MGFGRLAYTAGSHRERLDLNNCAESSAFNMKVGRHMIVRVD